jgi:carbamoyl-phosphate synthase large subunit
LQTEKQLLSEQLSPSLLFAAKYIGFSDEQIGTLADRLPEQVRQLRHKWNIRPVYKMVDTCAAEFDAETPYFYSTYEKQNEAEPLKGNRAVVIGSGPIRIGQGIEFDYCSVHSAWALQKANYKSIMINSNPETVSTDFDTSDRLYFEALDEESVRDILENESIPQYDGSSPSSIVQFGGQTAVNLAAPLVQNGLTIIGSALNAIDIAEDRRRFEDFLNGLGIPRPPGAAVTSMGEGINMAKFLGFPLLIRPSYVLGGRAMEIIHDEEELVRYMSLALEIDTKHPILIDKYFQGREVEVDAICDGEDVLVPGIMEHIERAGVHSGDSIAVYPPLNLTEDEIKTIIDYTIQIGKALQVNGLMNIQMVVMPAKSDNKPAVYVIEVNPRASRTIPFISKVTDVPMISIATQVMLGISLKAQGYNSGLHEQKKLVGVKAPVFSMSKLAGVDTYLSPEMKSTGEVMGIDYSYEAALTKAIIAAGLNLPEKGSLLLSIADKDKTEMVPIAHGYASLDYQLYATEGTASALESNGIKVKMIGKKLTEGHPNLVDIIYQGSINGIINTVTGGRVSLQDGFEIRRAAAEMRIPCFTSLDTARVVLYALKKGGYVYNVRSLSEYINGQG